MDGISLDLKLLLVKTAVAEWCRAAVSLSLLMQTERDQGTSGLWKGLL
jgi:hypothetical protein